MLGALIGAGASLLGGLLGNKSQSDANAANIKYQKEFAQHGVQWKVKDAEAAGIHPLYALGAQTHSFAPSSVGSTSLGEGVAQAGQEIGRAVTAQGTAGDRAISQTMAKLQLQRAGLENELLATQIRKISMPGTPPPMPSPANRYLVDGQGQAVVASPASLPSSGLVVDQPLERVAGDPNLMSSEPGAVTETGFLRTPDGWATVPSQDAKQRIEDSIYELDHFARNALLPRLGITKGEHPPIPLKPGHYWQLGFDGVWRQVESDYKGYNPEYQSAPK